MVLGAAQLLGPTDKQGKILFFFFNIEIIEIFLPTGDVAGIWGHVSHLVGEYCYLEVAE